jgi:hypothetical protein
MKTFKTFIAEASVFDPKYPEGYVFGLSTSKASTKDRNQLIKALGRTYNKKNLDFVKVIKPKKIDITADLSKGKKNPIVVHLKYGKKVIELIAPTKAFLSGLFNKSKKGGKDPDGAAWESLITDKLNVLAGQPNADSAASEKAQEYYPVWEEAAESIAKSFKNEFGKKSMKQYGAKSSKSNLSSFWIKHGGTNGTPKTDMFTKTHNISLKKAGGSQLASGTAGETLSTFHAALEYLGKSKEDTDAILKIMDQIEKKFTKVALDYTKTQIQQLADEGEAKITKTKTASVDDFSAADKKELAKFVKTEKFHKTFNKEITNVISIEKTPNFLKWYVFEAMSGYKKFKDERSVASVCVTFDTKGKLSIIDIADGGLAANLTGKPKLSSELIAKSKKVKVYAAWKSSGTDPYSTFRVADTSDNARVPLVDSLDTIIKNELKKDHIANSFVTNLHEDIEQLNDGFDMIPKVMSAIKKGLGNAATGLKKAWDWAQGFFKRIIEATKVAFNKIKNLGEQMWAGLMDFLGLELSNAKASIPSELSDFVNK